MEPVECRRSSRRVLWRVEGAPGELVEELWSDPNQVVAGGETLKDGDRCTVVKIERGGRSFVLKRYNQKDRLHAATHLLLRSRARWSFLNARKLLESGLPTPKPLVCVDERRQGVFTVGSCLVTEFIDGISLRDMVEDGWLKGESLREFAKQFAGLWQTLGQLRIGHGDMKATNFIIDPSGRLWLIDLDGMRVYRSGALLRRERRNDIARFMRNWQEKPEAAAIFRARIGAG